MMNTRNFNSYAGVIISAANKNVDKEFSYKIPSELIDKIQIGIRVAVPFGMGNKITEGFVVSINKDCLVPNNKLKQITKILNDKPLFNNELLLLAKFMKDKYYTTLYSCLKCIIPKGLNFKPDYLVLLNINRGKSNIKLSTRQKQLINLLENHGGQMLKSEIENEFAPQALNALVKNEVVEIKDISEVKNLSLKIKYAYINCENPQSVLKITPKQRLVINMLMQHNGLPLTDLKNYLGISSSPIITLAQKGVIAIKEQEVLRNTTAQYAENKNELPELTKDQLKAVEYITNRKDNKKPVLIHGVTGSGKTEIYLQLIEDVVKKGKQAIVLVPEISLTPQMASIFLNRFKHLVTVSHSRQTFGERFDQWKKASEGLISIMIGPRSAIFTPFSNLGIIIIDEEHENTYKSETTPKYSAKEVAIKRGELTGAAVILGSATPSIETYYEALTNKLDLITISKRVNDRKLPEVEVVDMRNELMLGNKSIFSNSLLNSLEEALKNKKQAILFLNRRGFSTFVSCRKCGQVMVCDNCSINYTYHNETNKLICHYCGKSIQNPKNCPTCGSRYIKYFGIGTERIEHEFKQLFPKVNVLRMDADTTSGKNSHNEILAKFRQKEASVLIGTQMIAKGLDFPDVVVVGIVAADISLNYGDFRAGETTFQLLTQVSGRAGRGETEGKVVIQTYTPSHYSIVYAKDGNYQQFYQHEISTRRQMQYPPFTKVFCVLFSSPIEKQVIALLFRLCEIMKQFNKDNFFDVLGPAPASVSKIKLQYRWKIIVKSVNEQKLKSFVIDCINKLQEQQSMGDVTVNLTLNPIFLV